jgi:translation initiation factor 4E
MNNLNTKWVLWYHGLDDNDWSINGYKKVCDFSNVEDFWIVFNNVSENMIQNSMLFVMRAGINPLWEDDSNKNGGSWSFKISKKDIYSIFKELCVHLLGENITKSERYTMSINGISISPKKNFSIIKIWNNDSKNSSNSLLSTKIPNLYISDSIYKSHNSKN